MLSAQRTSRIRSEFTLKAQKQCSSSCITRIKKNRLPFVPLCLSKSNPYRSVALAAFRTSPVKISTSMCASRDVRTADRSRSSRTWAILGLYESVEARSKHVRSFNQRQGFLIFGVAIRANTYAGIVHSLSLIDYHALKFLKNQHSDPIAVISLDIW